MDVARSILRVGRQGLGAAFEAVLILALVAVLSLAVAAGTGAKPSGAGQALAGKASASWIALAQPRTLAASGQALGSTVAFDTRYPANTKNPRIEVLCYQDGRLVYGEAGGVTDSFKLGGGGSIWLTTGGAADCQANLYFFGWRAGVQTYNLLASTSFAAAG